MTRNTKSSGVRVEPRDLRIFEGLFESRIMTRRHLTELYFDGKDAMAKERIGKKLVPAGFIKEQNPRRHPTEAAIYGLGRRGFEELKQRGIIRSYKCVARGRFDWERMEDRLAVSPLTVQHELAVMDAKVSLVSAISKTPVLKIYTFSTWPLLTSFTPPGHKSVKPDGYARIYHEPDPGCLMEEDLYLEIDRGTESLDTLVRKVSGYAAYSGSQALALALHASPEETIHFRTLFVFAGGREGSIGSPQRQRNFLARLVLNGRAWHGAWTTTTQELARDPIGPIWACPEDYSEMLARVDLGEPAHLKKRPLWIELGREVTP